MEDWFLRWHGLTAEDIAIHDDAGARVTRPGLLQAVLTNVRLNRLDIVRCAESIRR